MICRKTFLALIAILAMATGLSANASSVPLNAVSVASIQADSADATVAAVPAASAPASTPASASDAASAAKAPLFIPGEYEGNLAQRIADNLKGQTLQLIERAQATVSGWQQQGVASWYGPGFHGRLTASGERFNTQALTAAHLHLPFGTMLRVRSEKTGREVIVRVNDRGPYAKGRVIDLSQAAARALGIQGIGRVFIERLEGDAANKKR